MEYKNVITPVQIKMRDPKQWANPHKPEFTITNRYDFTDFSNLIITYTIKSLNTVIAKPSGDKFDLYQIPSVVAVKKDLINEKELLIIQYNESQGIWEDCTKRVQWYDMQDNRKLRF